MADPILEYHPCPVVVMRPPNTEPHAMVGVGDDTPLGLKVLMGVAVQGHCFVAHMSPEMAIALSQKLAEAAGDVLHMQGKSGTT